MPLITRRSSTRGLPLVPVGRWGAIRANCLSVSQKWSRLIGVPPQGAVNHETTRSQTALMGPGPMRSKQWLGDALMCAAAVSDHICFGLIEGVVIAGTRLAAVGA